ncbi:hypothetical protein MY11210_002209 [Beauveria gryllotalpidicola]
MHTQTVLQAVCLLALSDVIQTQTLAINNVGVIDMMTGQVQKSQNILIEDNMIVDIQNAGINLGAAESFDASGMVIMPGLVDMHVHLYFTNDPSAFATTDNSVLPPLLANGITTVQDLGSNCDAIKATARKIVRNERLGPRIFSTCEMLDGVDSPFETVKRLQDPRQVETEVQKLMAQGVNKIKVHLRPSKEVFGAIAAACKKNNIMFGGHVPDSINAAEAVRQGMNFIEHMSRIEPGDESLIQEIGDKQLWITGTLIQGPTKDRLNLANDLRKAGARMLAGTDLPQGPGLCPNGSTHTELKLMVKAGFTPLQALQTATTNAYESLNVLSKLGTIETGKVADMVLLKENPVEDINNLDTIAGVIVNGKLHSEKALDKMLRDANLIKNLPFACGGRRDLKPRNTCCSV